MTLTKPTLLLIALILVQILDIWLHAASGQLEPIRIASNGIIFAGVLCVLLGLMTELRPMRIAGISYLALTTLFLFQSGLTNPATGGFRLALFGFIAVTLALVALISRQRA